MLRKSYRFVPSVAAVQMVGIAAMLIGVALMPPRRGMLLLTPIPGLGREATASGVIGAAVGSGGRLVARGPFPGSWVVFGDRAALADAMIARRILVTAAPGASCGGGRSAANA